MSVWSGREISGRWVMYGSLKKSDPPPLPTSGLGRYILPLL